MDEIVIRQYRQLLRQDFPHSGELKNPSVFVEAVGENLIHCGNTGNFMQLYLKIEQERISVMTYLCSCEPTANVAVEALCEMAQGKTLGEAEKISCEDLLQAVGSKDEELGLKSAGLLALLGQAIREYQQGNAGGGGQASDPGREHISWDNTLSL
ncbi:MAG TPA: iron-sulfur cluster assembly scaffold protein [Anaerolineaceae bacterium]|nr:iron-sulfur cluster assembly scaffold protein [Anaerolineaceae bacterium]